MKVFEISRRAPHPEAVVGELLLALLANKKNHVRPGLQETSAKISADAPSTYNQYIHRILSKNALSDRVLRLRTPYLGTYPDVLQEWRWSLFRSSECTRDSAIDGGIEVVFEQPEAKWREIGTLQRRTIEAGVIARIYREMFAELGDEKA